MKFVKILKKVTGRLQVEDQDGNIYFMEEEDTSMKEEVVFALESDLHETHFNYRKSP